ncbi:hypothetical protein BV25DRAFT_1916458 [Artomyces pyxidatus]|uniref:Uncharacterized protein n=1 Tax=Artomyces pyxidatus TaxID=48021 RepID=A0ACB8SZ39_9AGAM|nr:hypothetical protein BV25DRAFT_1916458 [Artomyces pyxidatus]
MNTPAASPRFYVVFRGTNPGVYMDWAAAAPNVIGVPGAIHRRYGTLAEAHRALDEFQAHEVELMAAQMQGLALATGPFPAPAPAAPEPEPTPAPAAPAPAAPAPAAPAPAAASDAPPTAGATPVNIPAAPVAGPSFQGSPPASPVAGVNWTPLTSITLVVTTARGYRFYAIARGRQAGIFNQPWFSTG